MSLDQRSVAILNQIVQSDSYIPVEKLADLFNVSRRTIYNDLEKLNHLLKDNGLKEIKHVRAAGLYLDEDTKDQMPREILFSGSNYYEFSPMERRSWIIIYLMAGDKSIFLRDIIEITRVSRNTALEDIKRLKHEVKLYNIDFVSDRHNGYFFKGNENDRRRVLFNFVTNIMPKEGWYRLIKDVKAKPSKDGYNLADAYSIFKHRDLNIIYQLISEYEKQLGVEFTDDVLNALVVRFFLITRRIKQGESAVTDPIEKEVIRTTEEYKAAQLLSDGIQKQLTTDFPKDEVFYLAKHLLSSKVNYSFSPYAKSEEANILREVARKMIEDFQLHALVTFKDVKSMVENLLIHLKPAYYRIKYGIDMENAMRESIESNYPEIYHLTRKVIHHFENFVGQKLNPNEIAFIAMHFGGWLRKEGVSLQRRRKMLIVCTNGLGTSKLLQSQLEGLFSDIDIVGVASLREYEKMRLTVDFIVSTIFLPDQGVPVFLVNPILNNSDKEQLLKKVNALFNDSPTNPLYSVETIMDIVKRYTRVNKDEELRQELKQYFYQPLNKTSEVSKPNLSEILPTDRVLLRKSVTNWEEAITAAADPLLTSGFINSNYVKAMVQNIKKHGPYVVISPKVALPHATADDGVEQIGMSLLHLDQSIDLLGNDVKIFIVLASQDNDKHLKALSQLTAMFSNPKNKEVLLQATNKEQISKMIQHYSTR